MRRRSTSTCSAPECVRAAQWVDRMQALGVVAKVGTFDPLFIDAANQDKLLALTAPSWFGEFVFGGTPDSVYYQTATGQLGVALRLGGKAMISRTSAVRAVPRGESRSTPRTWSWPSSSRPGWRPRTSTRWTSHRPTRRSRPLPSDGSPRRPGTRSTRTTRSGLHRGGRVRGPALRHRDLRHRKHLQRPPSSRPSTRADRRVRAAGLPGCPGPGRSDVRAIRSSPLPDARVHR